MPVVECNCGMVMSVASGGRRTSCIRCGISLHKLDQANREKQTNQGQLAIVPLTSSPSPGGLNLFLPEVPLYAADSM